jgi:DNA-binding MarR family transcriptional regulator
MTDQTSPDSQPDPGAVAAALRVSIGLLVRRLRQAKAEGGLTMPETSALSRLDRGGPATSSALARQEQISPQSMGATLAALEARGLIERRPDPADGRRIVLSLTAPGREVLRSRREAGDAWLTRALATGFTGAELARLADAAALLDRLAQAS